jgi:hypothetical protein
MKPYYITKKYNTNFSQYNIYLSLFHLHSVNMYITGIGSIFHRNAHRT